MRNLKAISVRSSNNTAVIETGNRVGDLALALNAAGRAIPHGSCSYVSPSNTGTSDILLLLTKSDWHWRPQRFDLNTSENMDKKSNWQQATAGSGFPARFGGLCLHTINTT